MRIRIQLNAGVCAAALAVGASCPAVVAAQATGPVVDSSTIEEVVVTAARREQSLQDVAGSLAVLGSEAINERGLVGMSDYLAGVPSVIFQGATGVSRNKVVIRGVTGDLESREERTTGVYLGEAPISPIGERGFTDLKLVDIDRVEVLRGPQGTLYGSGAMGGALRVIPQAPVIGDFSATLTQGVSTTRHGGESYETTGAVNIPIGDVLAARVAAYNYDTAGYLDNVFAGIPGYGAPAKFEKDANDENITGARLALLFEPAPQFRALLTALVQNSQTGGTVDSNPLVAGRLSQSRGGTEALTDRFKLANLTMTYDFGPVNLISATTVANRKDLERFDTSAFTTVPLTLVNNTDTDFWSQEIRLSSKDESRLFWVVGGYYAKKDWTPNQNSAWYGATAVLPFLGVTSGDELFIHLAQMEETQKSLFADATYTFDNGLSVAAGLRWADYKQSRDESQDGSPAFVTPSASATSTSESVLSPRVNVSYKPNEDQLYYVQAAKGFRVGRVNLALPALCNADVAALGLAAAPQRADSDSLWSYEGGAKITAGGGRLQANVAAFFIDWSNIQSQVLLGCGFEFFGNAGKAEIKGAEFELVGRVTDDLTLTLSGSYNDAKLASTPASTTGVIAVKGDRLPGVPKYNLQASARYQRKIGQFDGFIRGDYMYVSNYYADFTKNAEAGDYGLINVSAGLEAEHWGVQVFADNLTDERNVVLPDSTFSDFRQTYGRPRTMGVRLTARY